MNTKILSIFIMLLASISATCHGPVQNSKSEARGTDETGKTENTGMTDSTGMTDRVTPQEEANRAIKYNEFPVAYVKEGVLYFFNPESQTSKRFTEEPDSVFNCVYSYQDDMFYYTVSKNGMLSLKEADLSVMPAQMSLLKALDKPTEQFLSGWVPEKAKLNFFNNHLLLGHDFDWENDYFAKHIEYSIDKKTTAVLNSDKYSYKYSEWIEGNSEPTKNYDPIYDKAKQFDFSEYPEGNMDETDYYFGGETADESKIVFGIALAIFDHIHGPYCVANADGSMMKLLDGTSMASRFNPLWFNNNLVYLRDRELCYTIASTNETAVIDSHVDYYIVRKHF